MVGWLRRNRAVMSHTHTGAPAPASILRIRNLVGSATARSADSRRTSSDRLRGAGTPSGRQQPAGRSIRDMGPVYHQT